MKITKVGSIVQRSASIILALLLLLSGIPLGVVPAAAADVTPPNDPTVVNSRSHTPGGWSTETTISMEWIGGTDTSSGVAGYSFSWTKGATETPDQTTDTASIDFNRPPVAAGGSHTVGLKSDGTVVAVGYNYYGQTNVSGWTDIVAVAAGAAHTVGLKSDGTVVAVGYNGNGQTDVSGWTDITAVAAGEAHTVGLKSDGTVVAVGYNGNGQTNVSAWTEIAAVAAGGDDTVGLKSDGTVVAVGLNNYGQTDVSGWTDIVAVADGYYHTVGLKSDGTVVAVGLNDYGQTDVSGWTDIVAVAARSYQTVGLKSDGTVVAVGYNGFGQTNVSAWTDIRQPTYTAAYSVPEDGAWWFNLSTADRAGNWTNTVHLGPFNIDTTAPITNLNTNPAAADGAGGWFITAPAITLTSNEPGAAYYRFSGDTTQTYSGPFVAPEGESTLYYYSVDTAGNTETPANEAVFKVDTAEPSGAVNLNNNAAYTNSPAVILSLSAADTGVSGLDKMRFKNDGGAWSAWQDYAASAPWNLTSGDGTKKVFAQFNDKAGNQSTEVFDTIVLDTAAPRRLLLAPAISTNVSKTTTFTVSWSGSDALSGVASYDVQRRIGRKGTWANWKSGTASTSAVFNGRPGRTYYFRARAKDGAGNVSAWSGLKRTVVPYDNNSLIASRDGFAGHFKKASSGFYLGTTRFSKKAGDKITYKFRGKSIALIGPRARNRSKAKIYINGKYVKTINAYAKSLRHRKVLYSKTWKRGGVRTITIENLGTPGRRRFDVDGLAVGR